ncbi:hypothetical protein M0805_000668 [Coniferiporia weirii]|nr:hypothetical protein M0805_000668 [Coniferiporia weirii]
MFVHEPRPNASAVSRLPPEILLLIFSEFDWGRSEPSVPAGSDCPWFQYIRTKKTLLLVCHSWWNVACPSLYSLVYLHRVGQLSALVRTLEESASTSHQSPRLGFGRWVDHIRSEFYVPQMWEDVYRANMLRLVALCQSVRTLVHKPIWDDHIILSQNLGLLRIIDTKRSLPCLRDLDLGESILATESANLHWLSSFPNLTRLRLTITYPRHVPLAVSPTICKVSLPNLQVLECEVRSSGAYDDIKVISSHWNLPALQHLAVELAWSWTSRGSRQDQILLQPIESLCAAHGAHLRSIRIDNRPCHTVFAHDLAHVLRLCPKLERLTYPYDTVPVLPAPVSDSAAPTHSTLRVVTFFPKLLSTRIAGSVETHLAVLARRTAFPALDTVVLLDPRLREARVDPEILPAAYTATLRKWTSVFAQCGVRLLNCEGQLLVIRPEVGDGTCSDESDPEYGVYSDSDRFPSSESSVSDPESDWASDSMVLGGDPTFPRPFQIEREEALALFEQTLDSENEVRVLLLFVAFLSP